MPPSQEASTFAPNPITQPACCHRPPLPSRPRSWPDVACRPPRPRPPAASAERNARSMCSRRPMPVAASKPSSIASGPQQYEWSPGAGPPPSSASQAGRASATCHEPVSAGLRPARESRPAGRFSAGQDVQGPLGAAPLELVGHGEERGHSDPARDHDVPGGAIGDREGAARHGGGDRIAFVQHLMRPGAAAAGCGLALDRDFPGVRPRRVAAHAVGAVADAGHMDVEVGAGFHRGSGQPSGSCRTRRRVPGPTGIARRTTSVMCCGMSGYSGRISSPTRTVPPSRMRQLRPERWTMASKTCLSRICSMWRQGTERRVASTRQGPMRNRRPTSQFSGTPLVVMLRRCSSGRSSTL